MIFMHDFRGGGAEKVSVLLANGLLDLGFTIEIIVLQDKGPMKSLLSDKVFVSELKSNRVLTCIPELAKKLRQSEYCLLFSHMTHVNIGACLASILAKKTDKLVVVEHNMMDMNYSIQRSMSVKLAFNLTRLLYKKCRRVIAVSSGVRDSIIDFAQLDPQQVEVIYNPVVDVAKIASEKASVNNRFVDEYLTDDDPTFIAIGSLTEQKNFELFIRAFAEVRKEINCNGIILGEGPKRQELELLIKELGLSKCFKLAGYVSAPYDYLFKADVFVLSSLWEGLPTVVIEAISAGIKVVSTDCPSGPKEILEDGKHGVLVDQDSSAKAFSNGMIVALNTEFHEQLDRAREFTIEASARKYAALVG